MSVKDFPQVAGHPVSDPETLVRWLNLVRGRQNIDDQIELTTPATGDELYIFDISAGLTRKVTVANLLGLVDYQWIAYRLCHKDTLLATGELEVDYPPGFTLLDAYPSVDTVSSSGLPTFDIKESGVSMLSTLYTIDVSEQTSKTAATAGVISDSTFTAYNKLSIHCTVAGTGTKGAIMHMKIRLT